MPTSSKDTPHSLPRLADKTVEELRALAKSLGLTQYSKLAKTQLQRLIAATKPPAAARTASSKVAAKNTTKKKPARRAETPATAPRVQALSRQPRRAAQPTAHPTAQKPSAVAASKSKLIKDGAALAAHDEDVAPALSGTSPPPPHNGPMLTLRAQQPGVLHAAWSIDPARSMPLPYLRLRILNAHPAASGIIEEIPLPDVHGSRYFQLAAEFHHVPLSAQIGYHSSDGRFIVMQHYSDMRLPSRHASGLADPQWWVGDTDFRALYLRSGGTAEGRDLVWRTSLSSRSSSL